jgi:hypothetical protein
MKRSLSLCTLSFFFFPSRVLHPSSPQVFRTIAQISLGLSAVRATVPHILTVRIICYLVRVGYTPFLLSLISLPAVGQGKNGVKDVFTLLQLSCLAFVSCSSVDFWTTPLLRDLVFLMTESALFFLDLFFGYWL